MKLDYNVPFYTNDDTHCFQACLKMILEYFEPEINYSWKELDFATAKPHNFGTHYPAGTIWMKKNGYKVFCMDNEDHEEFIEKKEHYLEARYGKEFADLILKKTVLEEQIGYAKQLLDMNIHKKGVPDFNTIRDLLQKNYLLICLINHTKFFDDEDSYDPHVVIVKGITDDHVIIHDPGPPAGENLEMSFEKFNNAWSYPDINARNVLGFQR